jgi:general secretion pathway protein L
MAESNVTTPNDQGKNAAYLLIRLSPDAEENLQAATVEWLHKPSEADAQQCQWQAGKLSELPPHNPATQITLLVPTEWLLLTQVKVPSKQQKHIQQALPFLVEENLAADIDTQHVTMANRKGEDVAVAIIERDRLQQILDQLGDIDLIPDAVAIDGLTLPLHTQSANQDLSSASLLLEEHRSSLRTGANLAVSVSSDNTAALLDSWQEQNPDSELHIYSTSPEIAEKWRVQLESSAGAQGITLIDHSDNVYQINNNPNAWGTTLNLLQGEFAPRKKRQQSSVNLRLPAIAASVGLMCYIGYLLLGGFYFQYQADQQYQQTLELYRSYFPDDRRIVNVRTQTRNHLNNTGAGQSSEFLSLLGQFAQHWQPQANNLQMQQIRFNRQRRELIIELNSKSIAQLDQLRNQLSAQGLTAELLSAIEETNGIRGRLKLTANKGGRS